MFSRFFIERPIFAAVVSLVITIIGGIGYFGLGVTQLPEIIPPTITVYTSFPGASAQTVADTVAAPIEQEVNGVEGMIYMASQSTSDGNLSLTVTFDVGTDIDKAQVLVQNRLAVALPRLPQEVQRLGVTAQKQSTNFLMAVALTSPDRRYDELFLGNYATLRVKNVLTRIRGVGNCDVFGGSRYGMRVWLDPEKLKARDLSTEDVLAAIREQNVQVAAGQVGQSPAPGSQGFQYNVTTPGRLSDPEQFGDIIVKADDTDPQERAGLVGAQRALGHEQGVVGPAGGDADPDEEPRQDRAIGVGEDPAQLDGTRARVGGGLLVVSPSPVRVAALAGQAQLHGHRGFAGARAAGLADQRPISDQVSLADAGIGVDRVDLDDRRQQR